MESTELSLSEMSVGQRMILAAQLAVARHWFNAETERQAQQDTIGGADRLQRITDDPAE
jgi:hypothetical protein